MAAASEPGQPATPAGNSRLARALTLLLAGAAAIIILAGMRELAWLVGPVPLGAILAVPLTLLVKAVLVDADPRAAWAEAMVGSGRPVRPPRVARRR